MTFLDVSGVWVDGMAYAKAVAACAHAVRSGERGAEVGPETSEALAENPAPLKGES